jgi:hypothetical protein
MHPRELNSPLSPAISTALNRLALVSATLGSWEAALLRAVETYRAAVQVESQTSRQGATVVGDALDRFHRSLSRSASVRSAMKHWNGLDPAGRTFIEMRLRLADPLRSGFAGLNLTDPSDLEALRDAVGGARRWLGDKPGTEHGAPIRALVAEVARVYRQATGKRPGLSSSQAVAGPTYMTPFEKVLVAVLAEAGTPLSVEGARSLYRYELRNKSKKVLREETGPQGQ